jgi:hypothetical protein
VADIGITLGALLLAVLLYRSQPSQDTTSPTATGPLSRT